MAKFCANGHQMEDSWEVCPYCQRTGFQVGTAAAAIAKTRIETDVVKDTAAPASVAGRKTVLLSESRKAPVVGWLVAMNGDHKGEDFRLVEGQNLIGSAADANIVLRDVTISARHASIRYKDGKFILSDLDSTNGTFLNDSSEQIARIELQDNDMVRLGEVNLKFKCL